MGIDENGETTSQRPGGASRWEKPRPVTLLFYLVLGTAAIYLATWLGPVAFYYEFQKPLDDSPESSKGSIIWSRPTIVAAVAPPGWRVHEKDGVKFPLPPGKPSSVVKTGDLIKAEFKEGSVKLQAFPAGFLGSLLGRELEKLSGGGFVGFSDAAALEEVMRETPEVYRFSWGGRDRHLYAARILTKMLLWEDRPVRRHEIASLKGRNAASVLVEYENGDVKVISAGKDALLVVLLAGEAPASWKTSPANWMLAARSDR